MKDLTDRQKQMLTFIIDHINLHGFPPSWREIGAEMDIGSTNGIHDHLVALERKGFIDLPRSGKMCRAICVQRYPDGMPCEVAVRVRREMVSSRDQSRARD